MSQAVIYTRFSPRRNAGESESAQVQEQLCREHAKREGWPVKAVYSDEAVSGSEWPRKGLGAALADLEAGDVLLVAKRDRIARSVLVAETVEHVVRGTKARIVSVSGEVTGGDDPTSILVRQLLAAVSEFERSLIAERTRASHLAKQRSGKRITRHAPFGFTIDPRNRSRLVPDMVEQEAAAYASELRKEGLSFYRIRKLVQEKHPAAKRGKSISPSTIKKIACVDWPRETPA